MLSSHVVRPSPEKTSGGWWGAIRLKVVGSELTFQRVKRELGSHRRNGESRLDGCDKGAQIEEAGTVGRVVRVVSRVRWATARWKAVTEEGSHCSSHGCQ